MQVGLSAPNLYQITLGNMITSWWVLYGSWLVGWATVALLGHPVVADIWFLAGAGADTVIQADLRARLGGASMREVEAGLRSLTPHVLARFALGVAGPLYVAVTDPRPASVAVLLMLQIWSACVAVTHFSASLRLYAFALGPIVAAVAIGLQPFYGAGSAPAMVSALAMMACMLALIGIQVRAVWSRWADVCRENAALIADLQAARDQAVLDRRAALSADRAKSAFLATMSHEIRTPLNGVLGMAQIMAENPLDAAQRSRLDVIKQSGDTLLAVLTEVLDLARLEAGQVVLDIVPFDARELMADLHEAFQPAAEAKGLALEARIAPAGPILSEGDPQRIRQVLANLVSNAIKFTETGQVTLALAVRLGRLVFTVSDTGPGVAPDQVHRLFQMFVQLDSSTTRRHGGVGLGLAISRALVELMGGHICVAPSSGAGATFVVELPQVTAGRRCGQASA